MSTATPKSVLGLIVSILGIGFSVGLCMSLFWGISINVAGSEYSIPLFLLFFIVGGCASLSNVTHFAYVSVWPAENTTALATGIGCGSTFAGILAILQSTLVLQDGFSVGVYYFVLTSLYIPAVISIYFLDKRSPPSTEYSKVENILVCSNSNGDIQVDPFDDVSNQDQVFESDGTFERVDVKNFWRRYNSVLLLQALNSSMGYGLIPSIISFVSGKFEFASMVLLLATTLSAVVDPVSRALTDYVRIKTRKGLFISTFTLLSLAGCLFVLSCLPSNSLIYRGNGGSIVVVLYVLFNALHVFTNTCIFRFFKDEMPPELVQHSYRWGGIASQAGALVGTGITFCVIITGTLS